IFTTTCMNFYRRAELTIRPLSNLLPYWIVIFFFDVPSPTMIYTLSLHDALPIYSRRGSPCSPPRCFRQPCRRTGTSMGNNGFAGDRKSTRLNSSHVAISYAVFCLKKKNSQSLSAAIPSISEPQEAAVGDVLVTFA